VRTSQAVRAAEAADGVASEEVDPSRGDLCHRNESAVVPFRVDKPMFLQISEIRGKVRRFEAYLHCSRIHALRVGFA
jgi:hypothetical protein